MLIRSFPLLVLGAAMLGAPASSAAPKSDSPSKQEEVAPSPKLTAREASLKKGMSATDVVGIMGKPDGVEPMEAPSGKAEVWTYRTRTEGRVERIKVGARPITTLERDSNGQERTRVIGEEPVYGTQRFATVRTFQLLMFNDHLLNLKVNEEEVRTLQ